VLEQLTLSGIRLQDEKTFENFNIENNHQIIDFLQAMLTGEELFAYLWGNSGVGRSHLLQAACHHAHYLNKTAMYLPLSEFIHLSPDVFDDLETMDLVAIDDLDVISNNTQWEEALFHLFNRLRHHNKYLLVAADNPPNQLAIALPDLLSRLTWGIVFRVNALTDEGKIKALCIRAEYRGMHMPEEVAHFLLRHYSRSSSDLFAALDKLDVASLAEQRKLTIPFVKQVLCL